MGASDKMSNDLVTTNPTPLIEMAVQNNSSPESLEKLMDLQERWTAGQARVEF